MATLTTLIPAYKKEYLAETFLGLQRQRFRDFRVILSDDSPGDEISQLIRDGHYADVLKGLAIEVVPGPKNARLNQRALIERWDGSSPLVHIHLDDDLIFPDFYRQHVEAHASGRFSASVSRRWVTQGNTVPVYGIEQPRFVASSPLRFVPVDERQLFSTMVPTCNNWIGEFSNMVLSAVGARCFPRPPADDLSYYGWPDVGFLLEAVQRAPIVIVRDHLGVFRQHAEQTTHRMHDHGGRVSSMAWVTCALLAWREGRISHKEAVHAISYTVGECLKRYGEADPVINEFFSIIQREGASLGALIAAYTPFWLRLLASHRATAPVAGPVALAAPTAPPAPPAVESRDGEAAALAAVRRAMSALIPA